MFASWHRIRILMPPMKFVWKMHVFFRHLVILTSKRDHPKDLSEGEIYPFWRWKVRSYQVCSSITFSLSDTFREKNMWPSKEKMQYILRQTKRCRIRKHSQYAEGILNKIAKPLNETFTGLMCMVWGFRICFICNPRLKGIESTC